MKAIMYHYVRNHDPKLPYLHYLHIDDFKKQLDFLSEKYTFLTQKEFSQCIASGITKDGVVLTFDDGLKDHFSFVLPELQKRKLWGIFYVITSPYITDELNDVHRIHLLLAKYSGEEIYGSLRKLITCDMLHNMQPYQHTPTSTNSGAHTILVKKILNYDIKYKYRRKIIDTLMSIYYPDGSFRANNFYLTTKEIAYLHDAGMIIGSHSMNHAVMSRLTIAEQAEDITLSFEFIESIIGKSDPKTFCYPYGGLSTFNNQTEMLLKKHKCTFSFNVESRDIDKNDLLERRQVLPRYDCNEFPFGQCR